METTIERDYYADMPWDNDCGCGHVRRSNMRHGNQSTDKRPGERPLNYPGRNEYQYYYDWQGACQRAKAEGWNAKPYDAPNRVQRAVQADFDRLRAFLADDWCYVTVTVESDDGKYCESCVMVESDYADEMATQLTAEIERQQAEDAHRAHVANRFQDAMQCGL